MRYKQMSLREAYQFLRARRPIIGPNFGFIRQLIAYEKKLYGSTSVSFIDTPMGPIPDIYLANSTSGSKFFRQATTIPIQTKSSSLATTMSGTKSSTTHSASLPTRSYSTIQRPNSLVNHSTNTLPLPLRSTTTYASAYGTNVNDLHSSQPHHHNHHHHHHHHYQSPQRPLSLMGGGGGSGSASFSSMPPTARISSAVSKTNYSSSPINVEQRTSNGSNVLIPTRLNYRTIRYIPSAYNKYRLSQ